MTVGTFKPEESVSVTEAAQQHFAAQLQGKDCAGIRLTIKESGCTGYMYVVDMVDEVAKDDIVLEFENGVKFYVDPEALPVVRGTIVDMTQEGVNNTLTFNNPNVAEQCGCGESFSVSQ